MIAQHVFRSCWAEAGIVSLKWFVPGCGYPQRSGKVKSFFPVVKLIKLRQALDAVILSLSNSCLSLSLSSLIRFNFNCLIFKSNCCWESIIFYFLFFVKTSRQTQGSKITTFERNKTLILQFAAVEFHIYIPSFVFK